MSFKLRQWALLVIVAALVILVDQISKNWVLANLAVRETFIPIPALHPFFQFTRSMNTGAAFGLLPMAGDLFLVLAVVIVLGLLWYYPRTPDDAFLQRFGLSLIVGGALGNVLDRIQHGHVVDFIHYRIPNVISNVSNLADHAIVLGVIGVLIASWLDERRQRRAQEQEAPPADV